MERLGDDIRRAMRGLGGQGAAMAELVARWASIVGPQIARNAWPARVARDGTLHVATSSSAWAFELANMRTAVLEQLRRSLGDDAPRALAFAPGRLPAAGREEREAPPRVGPSPGPAERERAHRIAAAIGDAELRERVAAAVAAALARQS